MSEAKPQPVPDEQSAPFWAAAEQGILAFQTCSGCGTKAHPPLLHCSKCLSSNFTFEPFDGPLILRGWTTGYHSFLAGFGAEGPISIGIASPVEHPQLRLLARLQNGAETAPRIGAPIAVGFARSEEGATLPVLVPAEASR